MSAAQPTPDELRRQIEETRRELGDTVDALSQKADVKEQARQKKDELQDRVRSNPAPLAAGVGGFLLVLLLLRLLRRG